MREIKFRVWHNASKEMFYNVSIKDGKWSIQVSKNLQICGKQNIMQFTGLHDNNGKEIYEGDIVEVHTPIEIWPNVVKYVVDDENIGCGFQLIPDMGYPIKLSAHGCEKLEVIGNIYENPELIEVK